MYLWMIHKGYRVTNNHMVLRTRSIGYISGEILERSRFWGSWIFKFTEPKGKG